MPITLEQIKAIQPMIKQGNSADDRTWTLNGQPVYPMQVKNPNYDPAKVGSVQAPGTNEWLIPGASDFQTSTPGLDPNSPEAQPYQSVMVPAAVYQEIQANPSAYKNLVNFASPELIAANGSPAWMAANGYMQTSGLPHAMEGAPQGGGTLLDRALGFAEQALPAAAMAAILGPAAYQFLGIGSGGPLMQGALSSGGAAASGAASSGGLGAASGAGAGNWLGDMLPTGWDAGAGAGTGASDVASAWGLDSPMPNGSPDMFGDNFVPYTSTSQGVVPQPGTLYGDGVGSVLQSGAGTLSGATSAASTVSPAVKALASTLGISEGVADMILKAAPGLMGAFASSQQSDALKELSQQQMAFGAPSRARYESSFAPGFDITQDPALKSAMDTTSDTLLRRLSAGQGNPFGDPGGLIEANKSVMNSVALPYLQNYRNQNASTGGYGAFNSAAPQTQIAGIGADSNVWNSLGSSFSSAFSNQPTLANLLKQMKDSGVSMTMNTGTGLT